MTPEISSPWALIASYANAAMFRSLGRRCLLVEESNVAFSLKSRAPALVEPSWISTETCFTGLLAGVPVHVGAIALVVVFAGTTRHVQLTPVPTQYVLPSRRLP